MALNMAVAPKMTSRALRRRRTDLVGRAGDSQPQAADRRRRQGGPSEDRALYSCGCGYAFDALVSTSVACPHCGDTQAW